MAGGRRKGCLTCRKRKIKCDERRPQCLHCEISRRECTGWANEFEFVAPKQERVPVPDEVSVKLPSRPKAFKFKEPIFTYGKRKRGSNQGSYSLRITNEHCASSDDVEDGESYNTSSGSSPSVLTIAVSVPGSPVTLLARQLVHTLSCSVGTGFSILYFGEYFEELPVQVGHSECLDAVLACFLTSRQCLPTSQPASRTQLQKYGYALKLLQVQLDNDETRLQPATLCSALILHSLEIIDDDLQDSNQHFLSHADGATAILRAFGPERINSRFELQLFYAHVPTIVFKSILLDTPCFIDSHVWATLEHKIPHSWTTDRLEASILHTYIVLPAFIRSVRNFTPTNKMLDLHIEETLHSALALRKRLDRLLDTVRDFVTQQSNPDPESTSSSGRRQQETSGSTSTSTSTSTGTSTRPSGPSTCYGYRYGYGYMCQDIRLVEALSILWRTLIVVTKGLKRLHITTPADAEVAAEAGRQLCIMTAELGQDWKPLGSLFAYLNLRTAQMACLCPQDFKCWVDQELYRAEQDLAPALLSAVQSYIAILDV